MVVKMTYANFNNKEKGMDYSMELNGIIILSVIALFSLLYSGVRDYVNSRNNEPAVSRDIIKINLEDRLD